MAKHGVYASRQTTGGGSPVTAESGIPFFIGSAPVQAATDQAAVGIPVICTSWTEAVEKLGYSDNWKDYTLCEAMYSHFKLFDRQPAIFCNVLNPSGMKETVSAADMAVSMHKVKLPIEAIDDESLVVKSAGGSDTYSKGTDYATYFDGEGLVIETLRDGACYDAEQLNVAYSKVKPDSVTATVIATGLESIELCQSMFGIVPDLICAPGFSQESTVAAVMATKAGNINGMFAAKALIDISTAAGGATSYNAAISLKATNNFVDETEIVCWPMLKLGDRSFHMSTQLAGLMARVDGDNGGVPYESPSNKTLHCDGLILEDGSEVNQTKSQADMLNANGIMTALNFMGGWTAWGSYTACYPASANVESYFIPLSRMFGWVGNSVIKTFWARLDKPMTRRLIDTVIDTVNIWLNGLVGSEYLLGARVEMREEENPVENLRAGIIKLHIYMTPPTPAQEIDFILEYDASYMTQALQA